MDKSEEMDLLYHFGAMSENTLLNKVKQLSDAALQLGLDEAKEVGRGNLLNVFEQRSTGLESRIKHSKEYKRMCDSDFKVDKKSFNSNKKRQQT